MDNLYRKKGELLSVWWLFVLIVAGSAIVLSVVIYYNADIDIRVVEADVLNERVFNCISVGGYLNEDVLNEDFDILKECSLSESVFTGGGSFYFNVSIYKNNKLVKSIARGAHSFEKDCEVERKIEAKHFPKCVIKDEKVFSSSEDYEIRVLAGSNQRVRRFMKL